MRRPKVAVLSPRVELERAVLEGGGALADAGEADAIVWTDPAGPAALKEALSASPARWVQLPFAGVEEFVELGVIDPSRTWTCAKGIYGHATAEHALSLMLAAARRLGVHAAGKRWWGREERRSMRRLAGTTAVLVGTGGIGRALAEMLRPLHVRVIGVNRSGVPLAGAERTVTLQELPDVVGEAHWVVLAAPLTKETGRLVGGEMLERMRLEGWLVNVARGGLVDTDALVKALEAGRIAGAALDATDPEPLPDGHPLWRLENVLITSHTANTEDMAVPELAALVERNVRRFAVGEPLEGLVDPDLGY